MRIKKRLLALCLCALLAVSGCERTDEADGQEALPVLRLMTVGSCSNEAAQRVSTAISQVTTARLGCHIQLEIMEQSAYTHALRDPLSQDELGDILYCPDRATLKNLVSRSAVVRLERLLADYPSFTDAIAGRQAWEQYRVNGYSYAIPFNDDFTYYWGFLMQAELCDALGIDPAQITDLSALHEALVQAQRAYPRLVMVAPDSGSVISYVGYDDLGSGIGALHYASPEVEATGSVSALPASVTFYRRCLEMRKWAQEGLILPNASLDAMPLLNWLASGEAFGGFARVRAQTCADAAYVLGADVCCVRLGEPLCDSTAAPPAYCISTKAADRKLCLDFLQLLYTDPTLQRLCAYGVEGVDYAAKEDGSIEPLAVDEESRYLCLAWPGREGSRQPDGSTTRVSPALGFVYNDEGTQTQTAACDAIMQKYYNALLCGMVEPDEGITTLRALLRSAGCDTVIIDMRKQLEAWLAIQ